MMLKHVHLFYRLRTYLLFALLLIVSFSLVALFIGNIFYQQAYVSYQQEKWGLAANNFMIASKWDPLNAKYVELRAKSLINLNDYEEAYQSYLQVMRIRKDDPLDLEKAGWLAWLLGDVDQAQTYFEKMVTLDPLEVYCSGAHGELGLIYMAQKNPSEAFLLFKKSIELHPESVNAPYWLPTKLQDGNFDLVIDPVYESDLATSSPEITNRILVFLGKVDYTQRFLARDPGDHKEVSLSVILDQIESDYYEKVYNKKIEAPELLVGLARASELAGFNHRTERLLQLDISNYPNSVFGYQELGLLFLSQNQLDDAKAVFDRAISSHVANDWIWRGLAEVAMAQQNWPSAQQALNEAISLQPLEYRNYETQAVLAGDLNNIPEKIQALKKEGLLKGSAIYQEQLAEVYDQNQEIGLAVEACKNFARELFKEWVRPYDPLLVKAANCIAYAPKSDLKTILNEFIQSRPLTGYILAGHVYRAVGQEELADDSYRLASDADSAAAAPHYFLGESYVSQGNKDDAITEFRQAVDLYPMEPIPLLALGRLYWGNNQKDQALEAFNRTVEIAPGWDEAQYSFGNALLTSGQQAEAAQHYRLAQLAEGYKEGEYYSFTSHLADAHIQSTNPEFVKLDQFSINGTTQKVLFLHPDSSVSYSLQLPEKEKIALQFSISMSPDSWSQAGDGVEFVVRISSSASEEKIFDTYLDPKNRMADRRWLNSSIDLSGYSGQQVQIVFKTLNGPSNNSRFDWAGWGNPRLLVR